MKLTAIIYGSSTGNTENAAKKIAETLNEDNVSLFDISSFDLNELSKYSNLILGTSTWGVGDIQDDWESKISEFSKLDLKGKTVAFIWAWRPGKSA